jgi:hypothetical protein
MTQTAAWMGVIGEWFSITHMLKDSRCKRFVPD